MNFKDELKERFKSKITFLSENKGSLEFPLDLSFPLDSDDTKRFHYFFYQLKEDLRFHICLDISLIEEEDKFIYYQFLNLDVHFQLQVIVPIGKALFFPTLVDIWRSSDLLEKEITKKYRVAICDGLKSSQRKLEKELSIKKDNDLIPDLPKYEGSLYTNNTEDRKCWYKFGPNEGPFNGKVRVDFLLGENKVYDSRVVNGYHFRNFEQLAKNKSLSALPLFFERLCTKDSLFAPLLLIEVLEELLQVDPTNKAKAMRMVWIELARIESHLYFLWELTHHLGFILESSIFSELLEHVYNLYSLYSGKVQNFSVFEVGGLKKESPLGWGTETLETAKYLLKTLNTVEMGLKRSPDFMEVTKGFSLSAIKAIDFGLTGPNLRACGVNFDVRKTRPSYFYEDVDFKVPLGVDGTTYDRFLVRLEELKQSIRIINQVLDHLPAGNISQNYVMEGEIKNKETFKTVESSEGLLGLLLKFNDKGEISHLHLRSPSLANIGSYPFLVKGGNLDGSLTAFQSLNIDAWELDR